MNLLPINSLLNHKSDYLKSTNSPPQSNYEIENLAFKFSDLDKIPWIRTSNPQIWVSRAWRSGPQMLLNQSLIFLMLQMRRNRSKKPPKVWDYPLALAVFSQIWLELLSKSLKLPLKLLRQNPQSSRHPPYPKSLPQNAQIWPPNATNSAQVWSQVGLPLPKSNLPPNLEQNRQKKEYFAANYRLKSLFKCRACKSNLVVCKMKDLHPPLIAAAPAYFQGRPPTKLQKKQLN